MMFDAALVSGVPPTAAVLAAAAASAELAMADSVLQLVLLRLPPDLMNVFEVRLLLPGCPSPSRRIGNTLLRSLNIISLSLPLPPPVEPPPLKGAIPPLPADIPPLLGVLLGRWT